MIILTIRYIKNIFKIFDINNNENVAKFSFLRKHELSFRFNFIINNYAFIFRRVYISNLYIKNIL